MFRRAQQQEKQQSAAEEEGMRFKNFFCSLCGNVTRFCRWRASNYCMLWFHSFANSCLGIKSYCKNASTISVLEWSSGSILGRLKLP